MANETARLQRAVFFILYSVPTFYRSTLAYDL